MLCDELPAIGATSYDFHKHLCENHFRERLLSVIQQVEIKEGDTTIKKWQCPVPNCGYQLPQKWVMAKHYGLKHQVAKQMYAKICDISALPPDVLQAQLRHTATANAIQAAAAAQLASLGHPVGVTPGAHIPAQTHHHEEDGDDLDDTFDDESFDENEALQRIAKMNEQQQQPHLPLQQHNPSHVHSVPVSFIFFSSKKSL